MNFQRWRGVFDDGKIGTPGGKSASATVCSARGLAAPDRGAVCSVSIEAFDIRFSPNAVASRRMFAHVYRNAPLLYRPPGPRPGKALYKSSPWSTCIGTPNAPWLSARRFPRAASGESNTVSSRLFSFFYAAGKIIRRKDSLRT